MLLIDRDHSLPKTLSVRYYAVCTESNTNFCGGASGGILLLALS